ncbi:hypothetical protein [Neptuniibacter halophilus]|uniref:hypothetical protein n=1 Tax=Neptuniibacter halophilus TaxID=651666 RepID=UPI002573E587|nr:hypothetical protein [Neptuniibacter halophilus]
MVKKIIFGLLLLLAAGIFVAWLTQDHWLPGWNQELAEQSAEYRERGLALGARSDQSGCFEAVLESFDQCSGFACTINHGKYLKACWEKAEPTEHFCDEVPEFKEKPSDDDKSWARHACWSRDIRGEGCRLLMRQQQQLCSSQP